MDKDIIGKVEYSPDYQKVESTHQPTYRENISLKRHYEIVEEIIEEARVLLEDIIDNHDTWGQEQVDVFVAGWEQKYLPKEDKDES